MKVYELIHTRCNAGMNIETGTVSPQEGFKEYGYSQELDQDGYIDKTYVAKIARSKLPYDADKLPDDGYVYHVADGNYTGFMLRFFPIPWERCFESERVSFINRSGGFINQMFVGDYPGAGFYPFELFGDMNLWDAQGKLYNSKGKSEICKYHKDSMCTRDEQPCDGNYQSKLSNYDYYYANSLGGGYLPQRDLNPPHDDFKKKFKAIGEFIKDGRQEALKRAVAFLIKQFSIKDPAKRRYLVIKDQDGQMIENWIAAIQCAFTPQMAAAIPFATRMRNFEETNVYTVNHSGRYQASIRLQDPNQFARHHAMIIGLDERDEACVSFRATVNSPFALIDGATKRAYFDADIGFPYYDLITEFSDKHMEFCTEFAPSFRRWPLPGYGILFLYDCFNFIYDQEMDEYDKAQGLVAELNKLMGCGPVRSKGFLDLCKYIEEDRVPYYLSWVSGIAGDLISWLVNVSTAVAEDKDGLKTRLYESFEVAFKQILHENADVKAAKEIWDMFKEADDEYSAIIIKNSTDCELLQAAQDKFKPLEVDKCELLLKLYTECLRNCEPREKMFIGLKAVAIPAFTAAFKTPAKGNGWAKRFYELLSTVNYKEDVGFSRMMLYLITSQDVESNLSQFMLSNLVNSYTIANTNEDLVEFIEILEKQRNRRYLAPILMNARFNAIAKFKEYKDFFEIIRPYDDLKEVENIILNIDGKVTIDSEDEENSLLASTLLKQSGSLCPRAVHVCALIIISGDKNPAKLIQHYENLKKYGFPNSAVASDADNYANMLVKGLAGIQFCSDLDAHWQLLEILFNDTVESRKYFYKYMDMICKRAADDMEGRWNQILDYLQRQQKDKDRSIKLLQTMLEKRHTAKVLKKTLLDRVNEDNLIFYADMLQSLGIVESKEDLLKGKKKKSPKNGTGEPNLFSRILTRIKARMFGSSVRKGRR